MKKIFLFSAIFGVFILVGAGCISTSENGDDYVSDQAQTQETGTTQDASEEESSVTQETQDATEQEPTEDELSDTTILTELTAQDIKNAFTQKYPKSNYDSWTVRIDEHDSNYARGGISSDMTGAAWFAKKIDGIWTIVADGQAIECSDLDAHEFPESYKSVYCS